LTGVFGGGKIQIGGLTTVGVGLIIGAGGVGGGGETYPHTATLFESADCNLVSHPVLIFEPPAREP